MAGAARAAGWTADEVPMSDGGEGLLLALGGAPQTTIGRRARSAPRSRPSGACWRGRPGASP